MAFEVNIYFVWLSFYILFFDLKTFVKVVFSFLSTVIFILYRRAVANAFDQWGRAANLTFIRVESGSSDINLAFVEGLHPPCDIITDGIGKLFLRLY